MTDAARPSGAARGHAIQSGGFLVSSAQFHAQTDHAGDRGRITSGRVTYPSMSRIAEPSSSTGRWHVSARVSFLDHRNADAARSIFLGDRDYGAVVNEVLSVADQGSTVHLICWMPLDRLKGAATSNNQGDN